MKKQIALANSLHAEIDAMLLEISLAERAHEEQMRVLAARVAVKRAKLGMLLSFLAMEKPI